MKTKKNKEDETIPTEKEILIDESKTEIETSEEAETSEEEIINSVNLEFSQNTTEDLKIETEKPKRKRRTKAEIINDNLNNEQDLFSEPEPEMEQDLFSESKDESEALTLNNVLPSESLILIVDKTFSTLLPLAINALSKSKLKSKDFELLASERKALKPALERVAKDIPIDFNNNWINLAIVLIGIYSAKTVNLITK